MLTSAEVPHGARLSRRNNSCRRGSAAACTWRTPSSSDGVSRHAAIAFSRRSGSDRSDAPALRRRRCADRYAIRAIALRDFAGERHAGRLAAAGEQFLAQFDAGLRSVGSSPRRSRDARSAPGRAPRSSAAIRRKTRCSLQFRGRRSRQHSRPCASECDWDVTCRPPSGDPATMWLFRERYTRSRSPASYRGRRAAFPTSP